MQPKLIFIEGLPGSGKSTTAQLVHEWVTEMNIKAQLFLEGDLDHPADYDGVACFKEDEYSRLLNSHEEFRDIVSQRTIYQDNHYFVEYRKIINEHGSRLPQKWMDAFIGHDVYELPLDRNRELITAKWKRFAERVQNGPDIYVFDCCFIQNPVTIGMIKYNAAEDEVISYITELAAIAEELNPLLIYVEQNELEYSFRKAVNERPREWSDGFMEYYTKQGYGKSQGYSGLEGTLQVLKARRELEEAIFNDLTIAKQKVNNSMYDLDGYKQILAGILSGYCIPKS